MVREVTKNEQSYTWVELTTYTIHYLFSMQIHTIYTPFNKHYTTLNPFKTIKCDYKNKVTVSKGRNQSQTSHILEVN